MMKMQRDDTNHKKKKRSFNIIQEYRGGMDSK